MEKQTQNIFGKTLCLLILPIEKFVDFLSYIFSWFGNMTLYRRIMFLVILSIGAIFFSASVSRASDEAIFDDKSSACYEWNNNYLHPSGNFYGTFQASAFATSGLVGNFIFSDSSVSEGFGFQSNGSVGRFTIKSAGMQYISSNPIYICFNVPYSSEYWKYPTSDFFKYSDGSIDYFVSWSDGLVGGSYSFSCDFDSDVVLDCFSSGGGNEEPQIIELEYIETGLSPQGMVSYLSSPDFSSEYIFSKVLNFNFQKEILPGYSSDWWNESVGNYVSGLPNFPESISDPFGTKQDFLDSHSVMTEFISKSCMSFIEFSDLENIENVYLDNIQLSHLSTKTIDTVLFDNQDGKFIEDFYIGFFDFGEQRYQWFNDKVYYEKDENGQWQYTNLGEIFSPRTANNEMIKIGSEGVSYLYVYSPNCAHTLLETLATDLGDDGLPLDNEYFSTLHFTADFAYKEGEEFITQETQTQNILENPLTQSELFDCGALANTISSEQDNDQGESEGFFGAWADGIGSATDYFTSSIGGTVLYGACAITDFTLSSAETIFQNSTQKVLDSLGITNFIYSLFPADGSAVCLKVDSTEVPFCAVYRWRKEWESEVPFTRMFLVGLFSWFVWWRFRKFLNNK